MIVPIVTRIVTDDKVSPGEVWLAQITGLQLEQGADGVRLVQTIRVIAKIVNLESE